MSEPTTADPTQPKPRCRAITTAGHRCQKTATYNGHLCWPHAHHRHPVLPDPSHVVVPLLEDHASVQLVLSQVAHGLLTHKLEIDRARTLIHLCQVASFTMPRPPRLPTPKPGRSTDPSQNSAPDAESSAEGGPAPDGQSVYRLALDSEGIICGDGDLPAPSAHWQPASPDATPWDLLALAPNLSKPTPRDPHDPDTHCDCPICLEIQKMKGHPWDHPHLQPTVNPYCKRNRSGCEGPGSPTQCSYCEGLYKYDPRKYDRQRRRTSRHSERSEEPRGSQRQHEPEESLPSPRRSRHSQEIEADFDPRLRLPNPIPEQFPDDDPMLRGYISIANPEPESPESRHTTLDLKAVARIRADLSEKESAVILSEPSEFVAPSFRRNQQFSRESNGPAFPSQSEAEPGSSSLLQPTPCTLTRIP